MLTPKQIEKAADKIIPIWDDLKEWIVLDLIDRITMRLGQDDEDITFSSSEKYRISVFEELGGLVTELQKRIARTVNISEQQLKQVFLDYAETAAGQDAQALNTGEETLETSENTNTDTLHPEPQNTAQNEPQAETDVSNTTSDRMKDIANDAYLRTNGELRNFTGTTADSVQTQFIEELDKAYMKVASNTCSQWQAAREAIDNIIKYQGRVTYPSGHTDTIEVAVIRAIRTGIARMSAELTLQSAEENGIDYVAVSGHLGARTGDGGENPGNHAWWQSKVYRIKGKDDKYPNLGETTGYPHDPHGLCGYNCRHSIALFDPDVMRNPFKQYGEEENKEYYENTQKQRKYEREIRKAKTEVNALAKALETATDPKLKESLQTSLDEAKAKRDNLLDEYKKFCNEHGFRVSYERMEIPNRGRFGDSDKSGGENSPGDGVANSGGSGIIKNEARPIELLNYDESSIDKDKSPENILADLRTSSVGRDVLEALNEMPQRPYIDYSTIRYDGLKGEELGGRIIVYANSCKDLKTVVCTLIHEHTHKKYGIGQSQWAECVCVAQEIKHRRQRDYLLESERRMIIKAVKEVYPEYQWRKGGIIYGRRKSR